MKEIELTQGQVAIVDEADFEILSNYKWHAMYNPNTKSFYAITKTLAKYGKPTTVMMHRLIMGAAKGEVVDHINHRTTDNRRNNLRLCSPAENARNRVRNTNNSSGYKGVSWHRTCRKWQARIRINGTLITLGRFQKAEDAYAAYCEAAKTYHGDFASFG